MSQQLQLNFDKPLQLWPPQESFPLNLKEYERTIDQIILRDIYESQSYLITTGFTSLAHIIETFGSDSFNELKTARIVIGVDPDVRQRKRWAKIPLTDELKDYWIEKGIDVLLGGSCY